TMPCARKKGYLETDATTAFMIFSRLPVCQINFDQSEVRKKDNKPSRFLEETAMKCHRLMFAQTFSPRLIPIAVVIALLLPIFAQGQPPQYPDKAKLLVYRDKDGEEHPVKTPADWQIRRQHILANMQLAMGPLPD